MISKDLKNLVFSPRLSKYSLVLPARPMGLGQSGGQHLKKENQPKINTFQWLTTAK
jgi:hypothetical protein